ncbi:MAG: hypothetical protein AB1776_08405 [Bacillota bacterium]
MLGKTRPKWLWLETGDGGALVVRAGAVESLAVESGVLVVRTVSGKEHYLSAPERGFDPDWLYDVVTRLAGEPPLDLAEEVEDEMDRTVALVGF